MGKGIDGNAESWDDKPDFLASGNIRNWLTTVKVENFKKEIPLTLLHHEARPGLPNLFYIMAHIENTVEYICDHSSSYHLGGDLGSKTHHGGIVNGSPLVSIPCFSLRLYYPLDTQSHSCTCSVQGPTLQMPLKVHTWQSLPITCIA